MNELLTDIIAHLKAAGAQGNLSPEDLARIIRAHNENIPDNRDHLAKKHLLPFYLNVKRNNTTLWQQWDLDAPTEKKLLALLQMKPRRTSSGVATITVITRPQPCANNCVYCPNDMRMPKSYLSNEPACQRAERNFFDPYLQVCSRMRALEDMGHPTDKVELIVLGGTWSDYPRAYQIWFMHELFRALNQWPIEQHELDDIRTAYRNHGLENDAETLAARVYDIQKRVDTGELTYNQAFTLLYGSAADPALCAPHTNDATTTRSPQQNPVSNVPAYDFRAQRISLTDLLEQQRINETAQHRVVGLVVETRPDTVSVQSLALLRELGCTKIQMGVQSTNPAIVAKNGRATSLESVVNAFALARLFGFKIHGHLMVNLVGATPQADIEDFKTFVNDPRFRPDEIKLYPCALVAGTKLVELHNKGTWRPYTEDELMHVLVNDVLATPDYIRISRMIRDIGADDILVGNKKTNLRQMVEGAIQKNGDYNHVREIRFREINRADVSTQNLVKSDVVYETSISTEHFLQWTTDTYRIVGFLRLSLPHKQAFDRFQDDIAAENAPFSERLPLDAHSAMIREVHVYGQAAHIGEDDSAAQHQGLGRALVAWAQEIAREAGYERINVISSVGTREYYRGLGFEKRGLYQSKNL